MYVGSGGGPATNMYVLNPKVSFPPVKVMMWMSRVLPSAGVPSKKSSALFEFEPFILYVHLAST